MTPSRCLLILVSLAGAVFLFACLSAEDVPPTTTPTVGTETPGPSAADGTRSTPAPLTPTPASEAGRPDCPQDWATYEDPSGYFSLCYPADWEATVGVPQRADFGHEFSLRSPDVSPELTDSFYMFLYWTEASPFDAAVVNDPCSTQAFLENMKESNVTLAGQSVLACVGDLVHAEEDRVTPPFYQATGVQIPLGPGEGSVRLYLSERKDIGQPHESQRSAILESLQVGK